VKRFLILLVAIVPALASCGTGTIVGPLRVEIDIHYSHYVQTAITVPAGRAVTFVIRNEDPIDHEWIVGDAALHERHRTGTEAHHDSRPTEVSIDAQTTRETTVTFASPGTFLFICHLPGHEAFGMIGAVTVTPLP
jgi:uncharacterized cupredoxin-like copper-binding protein